MRRESENPARIARLLLLGLPLALIVSVGATTAHARFAHFTGVHEPMERTPDVLYVDDLSYEDGTISVTWQSRSPDEDRGGRDDVDGRSSHARGSEVVDVQARSRVGSAPWTDWQSLGASATDVQIQGIAPGVAVAVDIRSVDPRGRATVLASGSFDLPSTEGVEAVRCVGDGAARRTETHAGQPTRALTVRGADGTAAIGADPTSGLKLETAAGAVVRVGIPGASSVSRVERVGAGAYAYRAGPTTMVAVALPAHAANPCTPIVDNSAALFEENPSNVGVGVDVLTVIPDETAPTTYDFPVTVPPGGSLIPYGDGFAVTDGTGTPIVGVDPPVATDLDGVEVDTTATLSGTTLHVVVDHAGHGFAYPIVLDPTYRILTTSPTFDPTTLDPQTLLPSTATSITVSAAGGVGGCSVNVSPFLPSRAPGFALRASIHSSFNPITDCVFGNGISAHVLSFLVCVQERTPNGQWPVGCPHGSVEVSRTSFGGPLPTLVTPVPCTRYGWYRLWASVIGTAVHPDGEVVPVIPSIGVVQNSEFRCLPRPNVNWQHIFAPDRDRKGGPTGWHWRGGTTPSNVELVVCSQTAPPGIYRCRWKYTGETKTSDSTFFPDAWPQALVRGAVLDSYYYATFSPSRYWAGRPTTWGWSITGYLLRNDLDTVATAFPNRLLPFPGSRKIKIVAGCRPEQGRPAPANDDIAGGQPFSFDESSVDGSLVGATTEPGEADADIAAGLPAPCRSAWFSYTAGSDTAGLFAYRLQVDSKTEPPPRLAVWEQVGPDFDGLQFIGPAPGSNFVSLGSLVPGHTYLLQVFSTVTDVTSDPDYTLEAFCACAFARRH